MTMIDLCLDRRGMADGLYDAEFEGDPTSIERTIELLYAILMLSL
jgi:hypothetical protein